MAGNAKPNIEKLDKEGKVIFNGTAYHNGSNADTLDSLLDGSLDKKTMYGVIVSTNKDSHFKFTILQDSNIYAYGKWYSDSVGSTPKKVNLYKVDINDNLQLIQKDVQTKSDEWYLLFDNLKKGTYQIKIENAINNYCQFTEWYVEEISNNKYLIKQNNQFYTIKPENYSNGQFIPLTLEGGLTPNANDYNNFGFDDINALCTNMIVGDESFEPIAKFTNDKIEILKCVEK